MKTLLRVFSIVCIAASFNANAISIDLIADNNAINLGDSVEVQVRISGLDGSTALGVYDVNFNYDASLFSLGNISWGDSLQGNQLDLLGFGSLQDSISGSGWLNLFELSFDAVTDLENYQAGEFTLFSILLNAIAIGSGDFSLTANALGDAYGNNVALDSINGTRININTISVPEPSSLLLLIGMLAILVLRTRLSQSQK
ncbi:cohesin domain-containing protein [Cellvibrio sp. OA-2007]|uniref:cohesin domain-containing protein n=1 Tax=Cellvibrio sp. OA-2007 TaxID=529823 RepID=UPI000781DA0D|nr:cohesin domain-containing protein [Cellvibrio sp. OA-2007]